MNKRKKLAIIIINYYCEELTKNCIESIFKQKNFTDIEVIIIDNGSNTPILNDLINSQIKVIKTPQNIGFGAACNLGVLNANSKYILFLNPDTQVYEESIEKAISSIERNKEITVLGCKQVDEDSNIQRSCARYITLCRYFNKIYGLSKLSPKLFKGYHMIDWDHKSSRFVNHVIGAFYLIRKQCFLNVGGFDEDFFVYYEDLDLSKRITDQGGKIYYDTDICIFHQGGGASRKVKALRLFYSLSSLLLYGKKHFSTSHFIILKCNVLFVEPILRMGILLITLQIKSFMETKSAYFMLYKKQFKG